MSLRYVGNAVFRGLTSKFAHFVYVLIIYAEFFNKWIRTFPLFAVPKGFAYIHTSIKIPKYLLLVNWVEFIQP